MARCRIAFPARRRRRFAPQEYTMDRCWDELTEKGYGYCREADVDGTRIRIFNADQEITTLTIPPRADPEEVRKYLAAVIAALPDKQYQSLASSSL